MSHFRPTSRQGHLEEDLDVFKALPANVCHSKAALTDMSSRLWMHAWLTEEGWASLHPEMVRVSEAKETCCWCRMSQSKQSAEGKYSRVGRAMLKWMIMRSRRLHGWHRNVEPRSTLRWWGWGWARLRKNAAGEDKSLYLMHGDPQVEHRSTMRGWAMITQKRSGLKNSSTEFKVQLKKLKFIRSRYISWSCSSSCSTSLASRSRP